MSMLSKCANSSCSASFRYLEGGRLFRLDSDPSFKLPTRKMREYFWLCSDCSASMTLRIGQGDTVIPIAGTSQGHRDDAGSSSADRRNGLLLSTFRYAGKTYPITPDFFG